LSDTGRDYCRRSDRHPYELFFQLEGIEHCETKVRRPQTALSKGFTVRSLTSTAAYRAFTDGLPKTKREDVKKAKKAA